MQNEEYVYFLTVKQAQEIAAKHSDDTEWDIWTDAEAKAKKQEPDTYDTFLERCHAEVTPDRYRRVTVPLTAERKREAIQNLWATAKDMKAATIYPNTGSCTKYDGCAYLPLCRAHGDLTQCTEEYRHEMAHIELENPKGDTP